MHVNLAVPGAPENFISQVTGTTISFSWSQPSGNEAIVSYRLMCNDVYLEIVNVESITLYDLIPETTYTCNLTAASSGGYGPSVSIVVRTEGKHKLFLD